MIYSLTSLYLLSLSLSLYILHHSPTRTMKLLHLLPLAAAGSALVLPQEQVLEGVSIEDHHFDIVDEVVAKKDYVVSEASSMFERYFQGAKEKSQDAWAQITESSSNALDAAFDKAEEATEAIQDKAYDTASGVRSWMDNAYDTFDEGHHGPHHPHHPPHHGKPNMTVYQLIAESKYTTKLAKALSEYPDLVDALNSTKSNFTVFAPTDKAFDKIPHHGDKPSKEMIKAFLSYHVRNTSSNGVYTVADNIRTGCSRLRSGSKSPVHPHLPYSPQVRPPWL